MEAKAKQERYERVIVQLNELLTVTADPIARMATIASLLKHKFQHFFWCGFYRVSGDELIVGPYQGSIACQILKGGGVCLESVKKAAAVIVPDVHQFPGHIACDSRSNSEICIPVFDRNKTIVAVLDIDSTSFNDFNETDNIFLTEICKMIYR